MMSVAQKQAIIDEIERGTPASRRAQSRPPNAAERARLERIARKIGRPKIGRGVKIVSISVERDLLKSADAYAKKLGIKRSELFIDALRRVLLVSRKADRWEFNRCLS